MAHRATLVFLGLAVIATAAGTIVQGRYTNRWGNATPHREFVASIVDELPTNCGSWELVGDVPFEADRLQRILHYNAFVNREYVDHATGRRVSVALILGPPGPTSTHVPEICFASRGYKQASATEKFSFRGEAGARHEFARATFRAPNDMASDLVAAYAWRQTDRWLAPTSARIAFGGGDYLFKVQAVTSTDSADESKASNEALRDFLRDFVKLLDQAVFARLATP